MSNLKLQKKLDQNKMNFDEMKISQYIQCIA